MGTKSLSRNCFNKTIKNMWREKAFTYICQDCYSTFTSIREWNQAKCEQCTSENLNFYHPFLSLYNIDQRKNGGNLAL